ncbi:tRNA uridine-5-carboxymethylaminomethyl(34) synthesis GTPase MnmE [Ruminococcaceae bacterium OttesenSCG-928-O06]|nr:tRNA uridine-5-carboxymethylaminomethyl(34) synthesis GTPase MnmE [Ruminococcaceae bacterium OttesenSCG-928-O06]
MDGTIAAIATPPGTGGIAVVRLSGPDAYNVAACVFAPNNPKKNLQKMPGYTAALGKIAWRGQEIDEGIALCFRAPHSYTGEDVVELSCHGGDAVSRAVLAACLQAGARPAAEGEFTRRALMNGRLSLTQAEAVMDLISAQGRQGVAAAKALQGGALHGAVMEMKENLVQTAGHLAAYVDYPEEGVEELTQQQFLQATGQVAHRLQKWIDNYEKGAIARGGIRAAIVGSPNVGKSTIFNLLSGFERAIVTPVAGTTRDVVREQIQAGGMVLHLADTAGLHETGDEVEKEGILRAQAEIDASALVLAVFDGSQPLDAGQMAFARRWQGRPALGIVNKSDLGLSLDIEELRPYFTELIVVSAKSPENRQKIESAIVRVIGMENFDPNAALLANERQLVAGVAARDALQQAHQALQDGLSLDAAGVCLEDALQALATLTGEDASQAVIDEVFSKFCVGK